LVAETNNALLRYMSIKLPAYI